MEAYTNFYLLQGYDDIDLQREYAGIIHDVSAHAFPRVAQFIANRNARKRIGFVLQTFTMVAIQKLFTGWMALLDKNTFESHAVYVSDSSELDVSEISEAGEFIHHGWTSTGQTAQSIYEMDFDAYLPRRCHVAAYTNARGTASLAGSVRNLGTSSDRIRNIDHFLTSDLMEPDNGNVHYTENLVRLRTCLFHMRDRTLEMQPFPNLSSGILKHQHTYARNRCLNYCHNSIRFLQKLPRQPAIVASGSSKPDTATPTSF